jgi:hypothetical protein
MLLEVSKPELLDAMRESLQKLEQLKLISPEDLDIIDERRILRREIDELEQECRQSRDHNRREPMM